MAPTSLVTGLALIGLTVFGLLAFQLWWVLRRKQQALMRVRSAQSTEATEAAEAAEAADTAPATPPTHAGPPRTQQRTEPTLDGSAAGAAADQPDSNADFSALHDTDTDAQRDNMAAPFGMAPVPLRSLRRQVPRLDAMIDAIVTLSLEHPISGDLAVAHIPPTRRAGSKAFYIEGLDADTGTWEVLVPGRRYGELQAGVQLASRTGALNEIEFSEFIQKVQVYADAVGASIDGSNAPDMLDTVARARELDGLAGPLDAQLTVTLRTNGVAWSVAFVQQIAGRLGFVPGALPGRLVLPSTDEGAPPMLALLVDPQAALSDEPLGAVVRECTLSLDVPQTLAAKEPFPAWQLAARRLGEELDATLCDDQGQAIGLQAFAEIGQELEALYERLEALDLPAGSPAARRLFS